MRFPENTLEGMTAALEAGACMVEFDVQFSADGVPIVVHDQDLKRTAGVDLCVLDTGITELKRVSVGEPARFGDTYSNVRIPTLAEMIVLLQRWPGAEAFVEIKRTSLRRFGRPTVLEPVIEALRPLLDRCVLISFDYEVLTAAKSAGECRVGWAVDSLNDQAREIAARLAPDFLFCKTGLISASSQSLWAGPWTWVVYEVNEPQLALELANRGIMFIETGAIGEMLQHPVLKQKACYRD